MDFDKEEKNWKHRANVRAARVLSLSDVERIIAKEPEPEILECLLRLAKKRLVEHGIKTEEHNEA